MSYLSRYDQAPNDRKWPLVRGWLDNEPLPFFAELRRSRPVLDTPVATLVALYDDVTDILDKPDVFTVALYKPKMFDYLMAQDDTPTHFREKSIMRAMLNRDDIPRIRDFIGAQTRQRLDAANGHIDVVGAITRPVPVALVQDYMGFTDIPADKLTEWSYWNQYNTFHNQPIDAVADPGAIHGKALVSLDEMKKALIALVTKRVGEIKSGARTPDDIVCRMLRTVYPSSVGFSPDRLVLNIGGLLIGTVETTSQATSQALEQLLKRPDALKSAQALAATDIAGFDKYVWEALRFKPISPYLFRVCASDYVIGKNTDRETPVAAGTTVLPLVLSATFDSSQFPAPDTFNPDRSLETTFHLGWGLHECLGKYIGLVMIPEMIRQLLLRKNVRADGPIDTKGTPFPQSFPVSWDA